eukprot:5705997-Prymnesium_polylepis.1
MGPYAVDEKMNFPLLVSLGHSRAIVDIPAAQRVAAAVRARVPWRRPSRGAWWARWSDKIKNSDPLAGTFERKFGNPIASVYASDRAADGAPDKQGRAKVMWQPLPVGIGLPGSRGRRRRGGRGGRGGRGALEPPMSDMQYESVDRRAFSSVVGNKLYVYRSACGTRVKYAALLRSTEEEGEIAFGPLVGHGEYVVYFEPFEQSWAAFDEKDVVDRGPDLGFDFDAVAKARLANKTVWLDPLSFRVPIGWIRRAQAKAPCVPVSGIQARTHADLVDSMEAPALSSEMAALLAQKPAEPSATRFLVFAESRSRPLKTTCALPERWAKRGRAALRAHAQPGEFFVFQLG